MGVKLREQKNRKGEIRFHLDIHHQGMRHREFITEVVIYPSDSSNDKREKKSFLNQIRAKRDLEIAADGLNLVAEHKKKIDFLVYFQQFIDKSTNWSKSN